MTAAGKQVARVRVVTEPHGDYTRYALAGAVINIEGGEDMRYMPRSRAQRLGLPEHDFWLFDERLVALMHFSDDDAFLGAELVVPGLLQTPDYARVRLAENIETWGGLDDLDDGVRQRMRRQEVLYDSGRRFYLLLSEAVLRTLLCPPRVMAGQLERLIALSLMETLRLGVIPFSAVLPLSPNHGFWIYDDRLVTAETVTAELHLTQPEEIRHYRRLFDGLSGVAHYDSDARSLITRALGDLTATFS